MMAAVLFYQYVGEKDTEFLEKHGYSDEEVVFGLKQILKNSDMGSCWIWMSEMEEQRRKFEKAGFRILRAEETYRPILFYDVGAFVWFARIIEWEFPGFSVERCFDRLLKIQENLERDGKIQGTIHRYLLIAGK